MIPKFALVAKKRAGKDTVCELIRQLVTVPVHRIAFADPLKDEVAAALNVDRAYIEEHKAKVRPMLQWWGTEWRRETFSDTYWVDQTAKRVDDVTDGIVVVTDCRFPNETAMLAERGGIIVKITRNLPEDEHSRHVSERYVDELQFPNFKLDNNGTIADLKAQVALMLRQVCPNAVAATR